MNRPVKVTALAAGCVASLVTSSPAGQRLDRAALGRLTFSDEFDGRPLSFYDRASGTGRWKSNFFYGDQAGASSRMARDTIFVDLGYCGIDPFSLKAGQVLLALRPNTLPHDPRLAGARYTAGMLSTERTFSQRYGYWEAKLAMPDVPGTWPAFWLWSVPVKDLTGRQWGGEWTGGLDDEIDVVEGQGVRPEKTLHTAHKRFNWKGPVGGERVEFKKVESLEVSTTNVSTAKAYGLLWTPEELAWFIDDTEVFRCSNFGLHSSMYLILSMGAGGWAGNDTRPDFREARLRVEHIRVYAPGPGKSGRAVSGRGR
jgi:beta-glucanase (GH16 family)